MHVRTDEFFTALIAAGVPEVPQSFSVVPLPHWDQELGIRLDERAVLSAHIPAT
jgi:hypothetical protein